MYIAVCDDQTEELKDLTELIGAWEEDRGTPVRVKSFRSAPRPGAGISAQAHSNQDALSHP